ncbi:hypothetical protein [Streptomyces sp. NPDC057199]|uniref:hypothetical protein n=1 Tax=Streptomyces sp. NPDC057199 TaxID=3346047 RepID=UPI00363CC500
MDIGKRRLLTAGITTACIGAALAPALWIGGFQQGGGEGRTGRQEAVAERGRSVMPFDLEETTHHFTPTDTGGVQDVVADQPDDEKQIALIRTHLKQEAKAFAQGDFGDPAQIHGDSMPRPAALEKGGLCTAWLGLLVLGRGLDAEDLFQHPLLHSGELVPAVAKCLDPPAGVFTLALGHVRHAGVVLSWTDKRGPVQG